MADPVAAAAALAAADLNGDGTISVSEAAQSGWTGGTNCNHGGYVSGVAHGSGDGCAAGGTTPATTTDETNQDRGRRRRSAKSGDGTSPSSRSAFTGRRRRRQDRRSRDRPRRHRPRPKCPATLPGTGARRRWRRSIRHRNAHGKAVSDGRQSDAVGGKNCNHGGAVSAAAKKDHSGPHGKAATKTHGKGKGHGKD